MGVMRSRDVQKSGILAIALGGLDPPAKTAASAVSFRQLLDAPLEEAYVMDFVVAGLVYGYRFSLHEGVCADCAIVVGVLRAGVEEQTCLVDA